MPRACLSPGGRGWTSYIEIWEGSWPGAPGETLCFDRALACVQQSTSAFIWLKRKHRGKPFCEWKILQCQWKLCKRNHEPNQNLWGSCWKCLFLKPLVLLLVSFIFFLSWIVWKFWLFPDGLTDSGRLQMDFPKAVHSWFSFSFS